MEKSRQEIENRILTPIIPLRRPSIENETKHEVGNRCAWEGCRGRIYTLLDSYLEIDGQLFCSDTCAAEHYMKDAGGRRVYGGAC